MNKHESISCAFCKDISERTIDENELCFAIRDAYPVTKHHTLIIQVLSGHVIVMQTINLYMICLLLYVTNILIGMVVFI